MLIGELHRLLTEPEGERLEFKKAQNRFSFSELVKYCCAIANEGGGGLCSVFPPPGHGRW